MRLALEHLKRRGWSDYLDRVAPNVTAWLDGVGADTKSPLPTRFAFLRDQLLAHVSTLQDVATKRIGSGALNPRASEEEANEAADLLERLILPVGLDKPLEPRSILLGGWQYALKRHGDRPAGLVKALEDRRLQDLVGKAIEMSTLTGSWQATA
jgi:hypothetical protein